MGLRGVKTPNSGTYFAFIVDWSPEKIACKCHVSKKGHIVRRSAKE